MKIRTHQLFFQWILGLFLVYGMTQATTAPSLLRGFFALVGFFFGLGSFCHWLKALWLDAWSWRKRSFAWKNLRTSLFWKAYLNLLARALLASVLNLLRCSGLAILGGLKGLLGRTSSRSVVKGWTTDVSAGNAVSAPTETPRKKEKPTREYVVYQVVECEICHCPLPMGHEYMSDHPRCHDCYFA